MKLLKLWGPVVVWAGVIFYFSSVPDLKTGLEYDFFLRKIAHIAEYFIFTFFLYRAFNGSFRMDAFGLFMYPAVFSLLYAISDELHQYFIVGRSCSGKDVLIDAFGIGIFYIIICLKKGRLCLIR